MVLKEAIFGALPRRGGATNEPSGNQGCQRARNGSLRHEVVSGVVRGRRRRERGGGRLLKDGHFRPHLRPKKAAK